MSLPYHRRRIRFSQTLFPFAVGTVDLIRTLSLRFIASHLRFKTPGLEDDRGSGSYSVQILVVSAKFQEDGLAARQHHKYGIM